MIGAGWETEGVNGGWAEDDAADDDGVERDGEDDDGDDEAFEDEDEGEDRVEGRRAEGVSAEANRAALSFIRASSRRTPRYIVCIRQLASACLHLAASPHSRPTRASGGSARPRQLLW